MEIAASKPISIGIRCPYPEAHRFLSKLDNFPKWASGLGQSLRCSGNTWIAETPEGPMEVRFTPPNEFGVLDHFVVTETGLEIYIPMRVIPNGEGCEVTLTLFRQSGMTDEKFGQDAEWVLRDLHTLKALLEA